MKAGAQETIDIIPREHLVRVKKNKTIALVVKVPLCGFMGKHFNQRRKIFID